VAKFTEFALAWSEYKARLAKFHQKLGGRVSAAELMTINHFLIKLSHFLITSACAIDGCDT
jgi:hypothetical protein